jgi:glycine cleavage system H protein
MKFTESHEWIEVEEAGVARIGITEYAQKELGDIVYVELPGINRKVNAREAAAVLESTKAAADVYSPAEGTIWEVNEKLKEHPELINQSPDQEGWLYKIKLANPSELDALMNEEQYRAMIEG